MKKILLGIIAINLTFLSIIITLNYMQTANAQGQIQKVQLCYSDYQCVYIDQDNRLWVRESG